MAQPHQAPPRAVEPARTNGAVERSHRERSHDAEHGVGWMVFAAAVIGTTGALNAIYGVAAISTSRFYADGASYVIGDLKTLGWITLALGAAKICASFGILAFAQWARWVGVAAAAVNAMVQLLLLPAAPFLALALFATDVLVVYGLIAYGARWKDA